MPLPDIPTDDWQAYSADRFAQQADQRIGALTFGTAADSRIADLNNLAAPVPADQADRGRPPFRPDNFGPIPRNDGLFAIPLADPQDEQWGTYPQPIPNVDPRSNGFTFGAMIPGAAAPATSSDTLTAPMAQPAPEPAAVTPEQGAGPQAASPPPTAPPQPQTSVPPEAAAPAPAPLPPMSDTPTLSTPTGTRQPPPISGTQDMVAQALNAADAAGIDPHLFVSLIQQESSFNPNARSPVGASGLTQLMPETARAVGVTDPHDVAQNLKGGATYLRGLLDQFGGDVVKALAAYNAGPGAVQQYGGVPPYAETQTYVDNILGRMASDQAGTPSDVLTDPQHHQPAGAASGDWQSTAESQLGKPYIWGSTGGRSNFASDAAGFDCSGFVSYVYKNAFGVDLPAQTESAYAATKAIARDQAQPGDVVLYNMDQRDPHIQHIAIYMGDGKVIQAGGGVDKNVNIAPIGQAGTFEFRRADGLDSSKLNAAAAQHVASTVTLNTDGGQTAAQQGPTSPLDWLNQQKDSLAQSISDVGQSARSAVSDAGQGISSMFAPPVTPPTPDATQPLSGTAEPSVWDKIGSGISDVFKSAFGGAPDTSTGSLPNTRSGGLLGALAAPPNGQADLGQVASGVGNFLTEPQPWMQNVVGAQTKQMQAGAGVSPFEPGQQQLSPTEQYAQARGIATGMVQTLTPEELIARAATTGAGSLARSGAAAEELARTRQRGELNLGAIAGRIEPAADAAPATGAYQSVMPAGTFETPKPTSSAPAPARASQAIDSVTAWATQHFTDRDVSLARIQEAYANGLGRPLNADEMAYELKRLAPDPAAAVKIDEGLKPAIQSVGTDYNALRDYVTLRSNVQVADALGNDARMFSGGITKADSQQALSSIEAQLGPDRFQTVQQAADQVSQFSTDLRQRLVDSGVLSAQQAADMEAKYPDWVKTRILDYMKDPQGGQGAGTKIGLASRDVHAYTQAGTQMAREDPIASTVAYAHQVEQMANKNEAFNAFLKIDQASPNPMLRQVAQDFSPTKNQVTMVGFADGQKVKYVTDNKALGEAINGTSILPVPEWTKAWGQVFRSLATSRNPVFLAGNAALDIPTYVIRESVRAGGPTPRNLANILGELAKGYVDAFGGLLTNEFKGNTARFIKAGGGSGGFATSTEEQGAQTIAELQRKNVFQINGKDDVLRLVKDIATLQPVESMGQRVEYGPRTASFRLAEKRGQNQVQAVINGRTVTVDFSQGGDVTKYINNFVPFLNVGFQGPAQVARAFRENPAAFAWTTGALLGAPAIAAEAWNRSDPQRARDYADIPQYVKDQGVVVMLPGDAPIDAQGNRKPLYAVIKLREWAPFASLARDAASRVLGDDSKGWQDIAGSVGRGFSPSQASSVGQLGTEALSGIPVLPAAAQLQYNKDFFRNRDIVTNRADTNASAAAKALTPVIQAAVDKLGLNAEVRPSAVEFFIRNQGAGVGGAALGASDLGKPRQDTSPTSLPGVGGLIGRFVGNQTGQGMQTARDEGLTPSARQILRQNGITSTPGPASSSVNQIPLKLDEETRYQQLTNRYVDDAIHRVVQTPEWATMTQQGKDLVVQRVINAARQRAGAETLSGIPEQERLRRLQTKSTAPSAPTVGVPTR